MPVDATSYVNIHTAGLTPKSDAKSSLDKDGFLKLLTAQMRNQDPQSNQDPTAYFNTISQMSVVEQLTNLTAATTTAMEQQQIGIVMPMIGKQVTYLDETSGERVTGTVQSVQVTEGKATVTIDGKAGIKPSSFVEVQ